MKSLGLTDLRYKGATIAGNDVRMGQDVTALAAIGFDGYGWCVSKKVVLSVIVADKSY